jgi:hypothetical protein
MILLGALSVAALSTAVPPAAAATPEEYNTACVTAYGEDQAEYCTCKTEQVGKLVDEEVIGYLIAFYQDPAKFRQDVNDGKIPERVQAEWPGFVMASNKVCLPATAS